MNQIVNLNQARKAKSRETARKSSAANRVAFGRTKEERSRARALETQAARKLDQARRDQP